MAGSNRTLRNAFLSAIVACCAATIAQAQILGPDFVGNYSLTNLTPPGVTGPIGGLTIKAGDPNTILLVGEDGSATAAIYNIPITRDANGHITGYAGSPTLYAFAPEADAGLTYGPGGVLFFTMYSCNTLGQFLPGSTTVDKLIDLTPLGVQPSVGGFTIVPAGFPNAGHAKFISYQANAIWGAELVPDGMGTFDVTNVTFGGFLPGGVGPGGLRYVDASYPAFDQQSVVIDEWFVETAGAYELDANANPIAATRRDFLAHDQNNAFWPWGIEIDSVTGDFMVSDYGGQDTIVIIQPMTGPLGTNYCTPAIPNSTGVPGIITAFGSDAVSANDVTLTADQLPAGQFGYFLTSQTQGFFNPPGSIGFICLGGNIGRYNANVGQGPTFSLQIDLTSIPVNPPAAAQPGDTWNFQTWYRDIGNTNNFTNGVEILFQ